MTAALAVLCAVIYCGRDLFSDSPLSSRRELSGPSGVFGGADGRVYIIDGGKKSVLALNASGELEREMRAGQGSFYYASLVAEGGDGSVYVADVFYDGRGTRVAAERIFRYKPGAGRPETVYEISYGTREDAPMQYGRITDIRESDGVLTIAVKTAGGAEIRKLDIATRDVSSAYYPMPGVHFSDLGVSRDTGMPVFTTRLGEAGYVSAGGGTRILTRAAAGEIPWSVCAQGGYVYYCELNGRAVVRVSASGELRETVLRGEDVIETVRIEDGVLYATDYAGYYAGIPGGEVVYHADVPLAYRWERAGVWAAPIPAAAVAVWLAAALSRRARRRRPSRWRR
jgi:outer membrane protein assembly factor BamB